jgi:DNA repair protein RecO (recombination protein O)
MSVELKKSLGIILRIGKKGETTKIGTVFTRDDGKILLVAKGARKPLSRLAPAMDLGNLAEFIYYKKENQDYHLVSQATLLDQYEELKRDLAKFEILNCILELTNIATPYGEENFKLFALIRSTLESLKDGNWARSNVVLAYSLKLLKVQGFQPELERCVECGKGLGGVRGFLSVEHGGVLCPVCAEKNPPASLVELRPDIRLILEKFLRSSLEKIRNVKLAFDQTLFLREIIKRFILFHSSDATIRCGEIS